jgi:hypothetical protein
MHRLDDMKTYPALLALAAGATAAMIVVIAPLQAKDSFEPRDCSSIYCASITENARSPSGSLRLADDYCNTRCEQQFNYCQYRRESRDHCARLLINCRRNCWFSAGLPRLARDLAVRGFCVVPDIRRRRTPRMMPALAGVVHGCKGAAGPERGHRQDDQ